MTLRTRVGVMRSLARRRSRSGEKWRPIGGGEIGIGEIRWGVILRHTQRRS